MRLLLTFVNYHAHMAKGATSTEAWDWAVEDAGAVLPKVMKTLKEIEDAEASHQATT